MNNDIRCSFCGKWQRDVRKLIAGPKVYICDECVQLCGEIIEEEACAYVERQLRRARKELEGVRAELKSALSERSDLERVTWLARHPDASRVAIMARHFANASHEAIDVPRDLADRARSLAEELEALVRS